MLEQNAKAAGMATKVVYLSIERVQHEQRQRALAPPGPPALASSVVRPILRRSLRRRTTDWY